MIQRIRIDDRLLHGQVAFSWKSKLGFDAVVIASDEAAADPLRKQVMKMCCPDGVKLAVRSVDEAGKLLVNPKLAPMKVFVVCGDPDSAKRLLSQIPDRPVLNLGGMQASEGRRAFSRMVFMSDEEVAVLDALSAEGVIIEVQEVPTTTAQDYRALRLKF